MPSKPSPLPIAIEYITISPQATQKELLLSAQGEAIVVSDDIPAGRAAEVFATVYDIVEYNGVRSHYFYHTRELLHK